MEVSIATNSYQKITNQNIATEYNKSVVESKNQSLSKIKDTVDITLPKNLSDHSVKVLNCQNGSKALMSFSEKDKTISCYVQGVHGKITPVKPENLSSTLKSIDTVEKFNGFLNNAYAKTSVLSDGDIKVDVSQQLKGGMKKSSSGNPNNSGSNGSGSSASRVGVGINDFGAGPKIRVNESTTVTIGANPFPIAGGRSVGVSVQKDLQGGCTIF